jgi:NAD(P)-dependent dehydrogenase (short-subunit alcohol dehydrogenase family)
VVTGASRGLGLALTTALSKRGWTVVVDGRDGAALVAAVAGLRGVHVVAGDVTDEQHRAELVTTALRVGAGRIALLVNNASHLGPSPQPVLGDYPTVELRRVLEVNLLAPLALIRLLLPALTAAHGTIVDVSSDAAVEAYPGWGGYGASKAALDHASAVLAAENPDVRVYAFDPGDMRTQMHQDAFPGEDISDRPEPGSVVPAFLRLIDDRPAGGRRRAADFAADAVVVASSEVTS